MPAASRGKPAARRPGSQRTAAGDTACTWVALLLAAALLAALASCALGDSPSAVITLNGQQYTVTDVEVPAPIRSIGSTLLANSSSL